MRCEVCGWLDGPCQNKRRQSSFFYIYLRKRFLESMTVPCFMKAQIKSMVNKIMLVKAPESDEYVFQLKHEHNKIRIFGPGYSKILKDYDMKRGERFRIDLDHQPPFFPIFLKKVLMSPSKGFLLVLSDGIYLMSFEYNARSCYVLFSY